MPGRGIQHLPLSRIPKDWDPVWIAQFVRDVLAFADVRNAVGDGVEITGQPNEVATISVNADIQALLEQPFVLAQPSGFLQHERTLAGEEGVIQIIDGGDDANITVELIANGIALGKLRQLSDMGVLGNPTNGIGAVQNIQATADGQAFAVQGTELAFTLTPTWKGDHTWDDGFAVVLGTGGDLSIYHDGTDSFVENLTGDLAITSAGDAQVAATNIVLTTSGVSVEVSEDGEALIDGDPGDDGQVLTSRGAGVPFEWADPPSGGGGGGLWEFVSETVVTGAAATSIVISGLDLDADECYFVQATLAGAAAGAATLSVQFNGDSTAGNYESSLNTTAGDNSAIGGLDNGAPGMWNGWLRRCPVTSRPMWTAQGGRIVTTAALDYSSVVIWDTAANLTSLSFVSSVASQIAIGSMVRVWKLVRTPSVAPAFDAARQYYDYNDLARLQGGYVSATSVGGSVTETGFANHPGCIRISTSTTTATSNGFLKSSAPLTGDALLFVGGGELTFDALVRIPTLLAGGNTGQYRVGFMDEISGAPSNGIHAQYDENAGVWRLFTRNGGSSSSANGPTTVVAGTWYHIRVVVNAAGTSAELFVDGVSQGTLSTNIPTAGFTYGAQVQKTAGTTAAVLDVDFITVQQIFTTPRY